MLPECQLRDRFFLTAGGGGWVGCGVLAFFFVLFIGAQLSIPAWGATSLQILSPAGGENIGRWFSVKWMASDPVGFPLKPVSIYYSMDNGNNYQIYQSSTENDGEEWCWLGDKVDTTEAKIKIEIKNINNEITAIESEKFNIISFPYTYLQSSFPGALAGGSTYEISWHTYDAGNDLTAQPVSIFYSTNNGSSWTTIATDQLPQDKYIWNIPAINAGSVTLKIRAVDKKGNIGEDNWPTAIRADPPVLTLSKPNGGEILTAGQSYTINWKVDNPIGLQNYPFTLYYSPDDGKNYIKIVEGIQKDARSCIWAVPSVNSTKVKIKITMVDVFGQIFQDESDAIFSITIPPIGTVKSPNGGEVLKGSSTFGVTWNPAGEGLNPKDYTINLKYSLNDGEWQSIAQDENNDGSCIWNVPAIDSSKVKLKVEVVNNAKEVIASDQSDSFFAIDSTPPQISLSYPQNGYTWKNGLEGLRIAYQIADDGGLPSNGINIYYSGNGGSSYSWVTSTSGTNGDKNWWINNATDTNNARIKIEACDKAGWVTTAESGIFSVVTFPQVSMFSPNGWESAWKGGTIQNITWSAQDQGNDLIANPITIRFSINEGVSWQMIASGEANDGSYSWNVPEIDIATWKGKVKIEAVDDKGHIGSSISSLVIDSTPPTAKLTSPNGGEKLCAGQNYYIKWEASDKTGLSKAFLFYSTDGLNYSLITLNAGPYGGYPWTVPQITSDTVKIRIEVLDYVNNVATDESDAVFSIAIPPIGTVKSPNDGEVLKGGSTFEVTWNPIGEGLNPKDYTVSLKYSLNDGEWQSIAQGENNDGSYIWDVPAIDNSKVKLKVEVVNNAKEVIASDQSNSFFTIDSTPPAIVISRPTTGETWENRDGRLLVAYQASDDIGIREWGINISYSGDNGKTYSSPHQINFSGRIVNDSNTRWFPDAIDTSNAKIKIEVQDYAGWVTTVESGIFSAVTFPQVNIYSPNGWEPWKGGTIQNITWSAQDRGNDLVANPITIKFSTNEGASWQTIASGEPNDGSYLWNVPELDISSWKGKVKIEAVDDKGHIGSSENSLAIDSTPPTAKLTLPNGGEKLYAGQNYYIKWEASDAVGISSLSLFYSIDSGANYSPITQIGYSPGIFYWTVPQVNSDTVKIKVVACDYVGNAATDESDADLKISVPPFGVVLSPNGGENFYGGLVDIKWQKSGEGIVPADYTINLNYQVDDGDWQTIATAEANDGSYTWPLPDISSQKVKIKIEAVKDGQATASDESDAYFAINSYGGFPGIMIRSPASGEVWNAGSIYRISWEAAPGYNLSDDALYYIYLIYTFDNALFYVPVTSECYSLNKIFDWKIPAGINTSAATIEVYTYNKEYLTGQSHLFSISSPPVIKEVIVTKEVEVIVTKEVEVIVTKEANVVYNPAGKESLIFPKDSVHGLTWVKFERVALPIPPMRGAKAIEDALQISGNLVELPVSAEVFFPVPAGASNPKVFRWDNQKNKWTNAHSVQNGDNLIFSSDQMGTYVVFDVVDNQKPVISNMKANGRLVNLGDSISDRPEISVEISDDYGLDSSAMALSVDSKPMSSQSVNVHSFAVEAENNKVVTNGILKYVENQPLSLGEHTFTIVASDEVGNSSSYSIDLYVIGSAVSGLMVYPNPYPLGGTLKFDGLSGDVNVYIYDAAADLVWKGFTSGAASISWDGKNHAGNTVAPGVYFYAVKDSQGNKTTGKIAVIK